MYLVKSVFRVSSLIFFTAEKHCRTRPTNIEAIQHGVYQKIISCYTHEDRRKGRGMMAELIESLAVKGGAPGLFCFNVCSTGSAVFFRSVG